MDRTTVSLIAAILLTILCWAMAVTAIIPSEQPASFRAPDRVESYVVGSFDKLRASLPVVFPGKIFRNMAVRFT